MEQKRCGREGDATAKGVDISSGCRSPDRGTDGSRGQGLDRGRRHVWQKHPGSRPERGWLEAQTLVGELDG